MAGAPAEIGVTEQWHLLKPKTIVIPTLSRDPVEAESPYSVLIAEARDALFSVSFGENRRSELIFQGLESARSGRPKN